MNKALIIVLVLIIITVAGIISFNKTTEFLAIDKCLDNGGSWNYQTESCDSTIQESIVKISNNEPKLNDITLANDVNEVVDSIELLYDFEFYLTPQMEKWYNENYKKKVNSDTFLLTKVFSRPSLESKTLGKMIAFYDTLVSNFRIQLLDSSNRKIWEFGKIGDWGYGIHLVAIAQSKSFIKLPINYFLSNAWINKKSINGYSETFRNQLIRVSSVELLNINTGEVLTNVSGSFLVTGFYEEGFILRKEIPEDMPCGDYVKTDNIDSLPKYQIKIDQLKNESGDFNIGLTYPRGC